MTDARLKYWCAKRDQAYREGDQQTVKECEAMIDEHYRESAVKFMAERQVFRIRPVSEPSLN